MYCPPALRDKIVLSRGPVLPLIRRHELRPTFEFATSCATPSRISSEPEA